MYKYESVIFGNANELNVPTIVMLHEGLGSVSMWQDFPSALHSITGLPVFVYSRRGYGASDPAETPRKVHFMHEEADALGIILRQMQIQNPVLFGHSDGASIALIYAGSNPQIKPQMLILEAPHVFTEDLTVQSIAAARRGYETATLKAKLARYHNDVDHTFLSWSDVWLNPEFKLWNIEEYLPQIRIPVLVIQGEEDQYGTLEQVRSIQKHCPGPVELLILQGCRHSPHRDRPQEVLQATKRFISDKF